MVGVESQPLGALIRRSFVVMKSKRRAILIGGLFSSSFGLDGRTYAVLWLRLTCVYFCRSISAGSEHLVLKTRAMGSTCWRPCVIVLVPG